MEFEELEKEYIKLYPDVKKLYGPYIRNTDGRKQLTIRKIDNKISSKQYAKALLEVKLGRQLNRDETVDHIDGDFRNDDIDNLQLLSRVDNVVKSVKRGITITDNCTWCNKSFKLSRAQIIAFRNKNQKNMAGPFCSRSCSGKYGAELQNNRTEALQRTEYKVKYYKLQDAIS